MRSSRSGQVMKTSGGNYDAMAAFLLGIAIVFAVGLGMLGVVMALAMILQEAI